MQTIFFSIKLILINIAFYNLKLFAQQPLRKSSNQLEKNIHQIFNLLKFYSLNLKYEESFRPWISTNPSAETAIKEMEGKKVFNKRVFWRTHWKSYKISQNDDWWIKVSPENVLKLIKVNCTRFEEANNQLELNENYFRKLINSNKLLMFFLVSKDKGSSWLF